MSEDQDRQHRQQAKDAALYAMEFLAVLFAAAIGMQIIRFIFPDAGAVVLVLQIAGGVIVGSAKIFSSFFTAPFEVVLFAYVIGSCLGSIPR
ncbi:MAG: hypothetical protein ACKO7W_04745 [Elainella sp.]